jgi:hypothetical protein
MLSGLVVPSVNPSQDAQPETENEWPAKYAKGREMKVLSQ